MTNEQIELAFNEASKRWDAEHPLNNPGEFANSRHARYFFFAGSEFGLASAKGIYAETHTESLGEGKGE